MMQQSEKRKAKRHFRPKANSLFGADGDGDKKASSNNIRREGEPHKAIFTESEDVDNTLASGQSVNTEDRPHFQLNTARGSQNEAFAAAAPQTWSTIDSNKHGFEASQSYLKGKIPRPLPTGAKNKHGGSKLKKINKKKSPAPSARREYAS